VDAGVVAEDFNAIEEFDLTLHEEKGLRDRYSEGGGEETGEEGKRRVRRGGRGG